MLSTPPAFNLSQDQTLQLKTVSRSCCARPNPMRGWLQFLSDSPFHCQRPADARSTSPKAGTKAGKIKISLSPGPVNRKRPFPSQERLLQPSNMSWKRTSRPVHPSRPGHRRERGFYGTGHQVSTGKITPDHFFSTRLKNTPKKAPGNRDGQTREPKKSPDPSPADGSGRPSRPGCGLQAASPFHEIKTGNRNPD